MAKRLLLNTLAKVLGEFIDINEENLNLSLAVWSGQIVLNNLKLKNHTLLKSLNLDIVHGSINQLEIIIPWTALLNSPVKIHIDGVYVQVGPTQFDKSDSASMKKRELERKQNKLELADKFLDVSSEMSHDNKGTTASSTEGYFQQMTTKIIDNLEITLKNIHIRYEDSLSLPGKTVSGGITLSQFKLSTCNSNWQEAFVARSGNKTPVSMYKMAEVQSLACYWNPTSEVYKDFEFDTWKSTMHSLILSKPDTHVSHHRNKSKHEKGSMKYILEPNNSLTIKMTHNEAFSNTVPKFNFAIESSNLPILVDGVQCNQIIRVIKAFGGKDRVRRLITYRPKIRPMNGEGARLWWKYATKLIIRRSKYIDLVRLSRSHAPIAGESDRYASLSQRERDEILYYEERIPLHALVIFRHMAFQESENKGAFWNWAKQAEKQSGKPAESGKSVPESRKNNAMEDDVPISTILEKLESSNTPNETSASSSADMLLVQLQVKSSSSLEISLNDSPIIRAKMALKVDSTVSTLGVSMRADLVDTVVEDKCTPSPVIPQIISVKRHLRRAASSQFASDASNNIDKAKSEASESASFSVLFETFHGKSKATISALPFVFSLNKVCIQHIMNMLLFTFQTPPSAPMPVDDYDSATTLPPAKNSLSAQQFTPAHSDFEVVFEAHAPKIIIPEDCSYDKGYLLLDTGYLMVKGFTGSDGMSWNATLSNINAAMPLSAKTLYQFDEQSLYLIKPFDVGIKLQTIDQSMGDINLEVEVHPEIRGELNPKKLERLLAAIQEITASFTKPPPGVPTEFLHKSESKAQLLMLPERLDNIRSDDINDISMFHTVKSNKSESVKDESFIMENSIFTDVSTPKSSKPPNETNIINILTPESDKTDDDDASFHTPPSDIPIEQTLGMDTMHIAAQTPVPPPLQAPPSVNTKVRGPPTSVIKSPESDPEHVRVRIVAILPAVVLDLTYDDENGDHSILSVKKIRTNIFNRLYDLRLEFSLDEISIEDSFRHESQRYLARTPSDCQLIDITLNRISHKASPLYTGYTNDVVAKFASLHLNCDVDTIMHLRPFLEVLLSKSPPKDDFSSNSPIYDIDSDDNFATPEKVNNYGRLSLSPLKRTLAAAMNVVGSPTTPDFFPLVWGKDSNLLGTMAKQSLFADGQDHLAPDEEVTGTRIVLTMDKISLALLRTPQKKKKCELLEETFLLQVSTLIVDIKNQELLDADVTLKSIDITDIRDFSRDYAFKTVFCPYLGDETGPSCSQIHNGKDARVSDTEKTLLKVSYHQESKSLSFIDVLVLDTSAFVALDTILDLFDVFFANLFAILDLLSSPDPTPPSTRRSTPVTSPTASMKARASMSSKVDAEQLQVGETLSTTNLNIRVENPRLIVIDDPTLEETEAIVGTCGIEVHYTKETRISAINQKFVQESLHVSVKSFEIFVLRDMTKWFPQSVLTPLGMEFHMKKKSRNDVNIMTNISFEVDEINAKITFHDIYLAQSIFTRRLLSDYENGVRPTATNNNNSNTTDTKGLSPVKAPISDTTGNNTTDAQPSFVISINVGNAQLMTINDYKGRNIPVLRTTLTETSFFAEGFPQMLEGDGHITISTDFYHSELGVWEPFIESWKPTISVIFSQNSKLFELKSDRTLQLTTSGTMLERLTEAMVLLTFREIFETRETVPDIEMINLLGEGVDLEVIDSASSTSLFHLGGRDTAIVPKIPDLTKKSWMQASQLPKSVDVNFCGVLSEKRKSLFHLPFNVRKPRLYNIQPLTKHSDGGARHPKSIILEPIVEEAYENSRYDPITGRWRHPYLLGDPHQWTDASGTIQKDIATFKLTSDKWEWQDIWTVDVQGIIGEEIDADGWEYSTAFSSFSIANKRRANMSMDCVRRRRWIRTRSPKASLIDEDIRPLSLIWDVRVLSNGGRKVFIRSGLQIENSIPVPIMISLQYSTWAHDIEFGPIAANETFNVPLLYSFATSIKIKPCDSDYNWSKSMPCNIQQYDFYTVRDITSEGVSSVKADTKLKLSMRVVSKQENKSLLIRILPHILITNALPCDLKYKCASGDGQKERGLLKSGETVKLTHVNIFLQPKIAFKVGKLMWSEFKPITANKDQASTAVELATSQGDIALVLSYSAALGEGNNVHITMYSKSAIYDYSGLDISVWSHIKKNVSLIRHTYSRVEEDNNLNLIPQENLQTFLSVFDSPESVVTDIVADSKKKYTTCRLAKGESVYIDKTVTWTYLPPCISGSWFISTAYSDHMSRCRQLLQFRLVHPSLVLILVDMKIESAPRWLVDDGFSKTVEHAVARTVIQGRLIEYHYCIYGKYFGLTSGDDTVVLRSNWNKNLGSMYIPVIIPDPRVENMGYTSPKAEIGVTRSTDMLDTIGDDDYADRPTRSSHIAPVVASNGEVEYERPTNQPISNRVETKQPATKASEILSNFNALLTQVLYDSAYDSNVVDRYWTDGGKFISLFHSFDDVVALGLFKGKIWSDDFNISLSKNVHTGYMEVVSNMTGYQLYYSLGTLPGLYHHTETLTIMPRYCIVNCMDEPVFVSQKGSKDSIMIGSYQTENWHKSDIRLSNNILVRCESTVWSLASIDINEAGSSLIYLPRKKTAVKPSKDDEGPLVLHVEVKQADDSEKCAVVIVIWRATVEGQAGISIKNETDLPVTVLQADVPFDTLGMDPAGFELTVLPNCWVPFGWADPDFGNNLKVAVGDSITGMGAKKRVATISLLKTGELLRLPDNSGRHGPLGEVLLSVSTGNSGRVLKITRMKGYTAEAPLKIENGAEDGVDPAANVNTVAFNFVLSSLGLSLILEKPIRREYMSLYIDGLDAQVKKRGTLTSFEFEVVDLQIDNYSETMVYPVMLHSTKKDVLQSVNIGVDDFFEEEEDPNADYSNIEESDVDGKKAVKKPQTGVASKYGYEKEVQGVKDFTKNQKRPDEDTPLLQIAVVKDVSPDTSTPLYRYIAVRLLPIVVEADSSTLQVLYFDLIRSLKIISSAQALATTEPQTWIQDYNKSVLSPQTQLQQVSVYHAQTITQASRMFVEKLIIHPLKVILTFVQTPFPRPMGKETFQSTMINILTTFAAVDRMQLKLKSFEVEDAMESKDSLMTFVINRTLQDLQSQLGQIAGSLSVLGSPLGFARKVGSGVKAFFYEPYQGMVHSPHDFVVGLGKGTSSLFAGVVTGAMNSTVAFVGTAAKGISYLSGDSDYVRKHALKRQRFRAYRSNLMDSIVDGSDSVMSGFTSGFTGLITKPFEEARKRGAMGFFQGIGLGLIGAAVKPVMGFTEGITSVASGISHSVEASLYVHVRPARTLDRSPYDPSETVIICLQLEAAFAQDFVIRRAKLNSYEDHFLNFVPMVDEGESIILSDIYVYWKKAKSLWGRTWANISHCILMGDTVGVMLYAGAENGKPEAVSITCGSKPKALEVYAALSQFSNRMGNPALVIPVDILELESSEGGNNDIGIGNGSVAIGSDSVRDMKDLLTFKESLIARQGRAASLAGELDEYRFGMVNGSKLQQITGPETDVLRRAELQLCAPYNSLKELDERHWRLIWEWECTHLNLQTSRCCTTMIINRSESPIQIARVQIVTGKNVLMIGNAETGYEVESRLIMPGGIVTIFIWAFSPTPIELGHLKANITTVAFNATVASTQRESCLESRSGFSVGFLEKSVSEWWSKYVILVD